MKHTWSVLFGVCLLVIGYYCTAGAAVACQGKTLLLLDSNIGGTEYIFSVRRVSQENGTSKQVFEIRCVACAKHMLLHEDTLDYPISIYRVSDESPLFFTLWTTGSAYRIRVFDVGSNGARSVLDVGATVPPQVFRDQSDRLVVSTGNRFHISHSSYRWNGTTFQQK